MAWVIADSVPSVWWFRKEGPTGILRWLPWEGDGSDSIGIRDSLFTMRRERRGRVSVRCLQGNWKNKAQILTLFEPGKETEVQGRGNFLSRCEISGGIFKLCEINLDLEIVRGRLFHS